MLKRLLYILSHILTLASCNQRQNTNNTNQVDTFVHTDSVKTSPFANVSHVKFEDIFKTTIDSTYPCQLANPDTSVYGVILRDKESALKQLGEKFETIEDNIDMPHMTYYSQDKSQTLTVFFHYGDYRNEFSEFQVKRISTNDTAEILPTNKFVTNSGIMLGLPKVEIISIFGECFKTINKNINTEIIKYRIDDFPNSEFLHRFNMPSYYSEYEFRDDKLVRFRFGFEYP